MRTLTAEEIIELCERESVYCVVRQLSGRRGMALAKAGFENLDVHAFGAGDDVYVALTDALNRLGVVASVPGPELKNEANERQDQSEG